LTHVEQCMISTIEGAARAECRKFIEFSKEIK
jgi:hypothetical protein